MVLSNKKLKQKLRASLAESVANSLSASGPNHADAVETAPQSLKQLLDSSTLKPRLTKRENRRKVRSLKGFGEDDLKGDVGVEGNGERNELDGSGGDGKEQGKKIKKDKKRKRDGEIGGSGGEVKESAKKKKKKNKKAKKKMKKKADEGVKEEEKKEKSEAKDEVDGRGSAQIAGVVDASQANVDNARKVYVGGIPYYSTEDDMRSYFESCGTITEIDCMTFPESGKFRGIAIISFKTDAAAKRALALNGADMGGLFLKIQPYKDTRPSKTSAPKTSNFVPPVVEGYNRIYIGNLSWDITEEDLRNFLSGCNISSLRFGMDKEIGEFRGYAHVDFPDGDSMKKAIRLNQKVLCGRPVKITSAIPKKNIKAQPEAVDNHTNNTEVDNNNDSPDDNVQIESETKDPSEVLQVVSNSTPAVISTGKMRRRTCYLCGEKGHISSACPKSPSETFHQPK